MNFTPGYIHFEAYAKDVDGRITRVEFYSGSTLLNTQYQFPYTTVWKDLPVGTYTVTAVATDNWGAHTASAPVTVRVIQGNRSMVSNRELSVNDKANINEFVSLRLIPNPVTNILNIYPKGLDPDKPVRISILSSSGVVMKTISSDVLSIRYHVVVFAVVLVIVIQWYWLLKKEEKVRS